MQYVLPELRPDRLHRRARMTNQTTTMTTMTGILDLPQRGDGRLRQILTAPVIRQDDPIVPVSLLERFPLRTGQELTVEVQIRGPMAQTDPSPAPGTPNGAPSNNHSHSQNGFGHNGARRGGRRRRRGRGGGHQQQQSNQTNGQTSVRSVVQSVLMIDGIKPDAYASRLPYEQLTSIDPQPRLTLEYPGCPPANRLIDLFCPIGFGTRGLVVSPPKAGKTTLLQQICHGIKHNHAGVEIIALLIDERPEEVTDFKRNVPCLCLASSNDQDIEQHVNLAIFAIDRARRMLEAGKDVVVLLDSLTRMGRAFNASRTHANSGRTMTGGLDSRALEVPKRLFGTARKAEEGGSLTIIASCLVDTGSQADQIIFEEFKGTGNMELILDRDISERRLFPAMNLAASGTRKEHLLLTPKELATMTALRRSLLSMSPVSQIERLLAALDRFPTNAQLVGQE